MKLSARNQLPGVVQEVHVGEIMARVLVKVGDNIVESVITRQSVEEMGLKQGDSVLVVIKSTEVMVQKGWPSANRRRTRDRIPIVYH
jgi:molybdopterin-binding protein